MFANRRMLPNALDGTMGSCVDSATLSSMALMGVAGSFSCGVELPVLDASVTSDLCRLEDFDVVVAGLDLLRDALLVVSDFTDPFVRSLSCCAMPPAGSGCACVVWSPPFEGACVAVSGSTILGVAEYSSGRLTECDTDFTFKCLSLHFFVLCEGES